MPSRSFYPASLVEEILSDTKAAEILKRNFLDYVGNIPFYEETPVLRDLLNAPAVHFPHEKQQRLEQMLREV